MSSSLTRPEGEARAAGSQDADQLGDLIGEGRNVGGGTNGNDDTREGEEHEGILVPSLQETSRAWFVGSVGRWGQRTTGKAGGWKRAVRWG